MPLAANTMKNAGRRSNGGGTVRRLVSGMSLSPHGGSLNTVASSENSLQANFEDLRKAEVELPRIPIPRTWVNKGKREGRGPVFWDPGLLTLPPRSRKAGLYLVL